MVNNQTFDLMDIFKNMDYFHRDFNGSASIKKVLPVMTNISYDDLEVGN
jgi:lipopolysaccharide biosynthesis protein